MVWETVANVRIPAVELTVITMSRVTRFVDICVSVLSRGIETDLVHAIDTVPGLRGHGLLGGE